QYVQQVNVSATPTIAEITAALAPESVATTAANRTDTLFANPVQPYPYAASARNDGASPATQTVNLTSASQQTTRPPNQPYTYVASAKNDVASPATQSPSLTLWTTSATTGIVDWTAEVQPPGTTVSFLYRPGGLNYSSANVGMSSGHHQAPIQFTGGWERVEYLIEYRDAWGRVVKSASGAIPLSFSGQTTAQAVFNFTQVTSTPSAGSSIRGYIPLAQVSSIDRVTASVTNAITGAVVTSNVVTYPEDEASYNGEGNLKV